MRNLPWTTARKHTATRRGSHKSAKDNIAFLREEFAAMLLKKHWTILPAALVSELPNLRLSPLGVVPQHDRRPRTIVDYTFSSVNEDTIIDAPTESMQFGRTLHCLLSRIDLSSSMETCYRESEP